ncbi:putative tetratricopeptide repeat protein 41 [Rhinophrynus dorsalis]
MRQPSETLDTTTEDHNYYFTHRPPIRPYICSTIKDFQEEKNYLVQNTFSQLDHFCFNRGTAFKPVDLRWSVEERPNHIKSYHISQQLKLCLDYIENTSPFFICLLGHTYGEFNPETHGQLPNVSSDIFDLSALSKVEQNLIVAANGGYPWVLEKENQDCSLTELEIMQAALLKDAQFQYFYFRDHAYIEEKLHKANEYEKKTIISTFESKNEYERSKIWELKIKIVDKGLPVRFFKTNEELGRLVLKDWCDVIEKLYPLCATPVNIGHEHSLAQAYNEAFAESLCKQFVPTQQANDLLMVLNTFAFGALAQEQSSNFSGSDSIECSSIQDSEARSKLLAELKSILVLNGDRGCGKSTLVAKWLSLFRSNNPTVTVIPYFIGSSGASSDVMSFMRHCITVLQCEYFGIHSEDVSSSDNFGDLWIFPLLVEAFVASIALKPCVLLLDGVDELSGIHGLSTQQAKGFSWLPVSLPHHCKMILTTTTSHLSFKCLMGRSDVQMAKLKNTSDEAEQLCIFIKQLAMPDKYIGPDQLKCIIHKKRKLTPLQLSILAHELRTCGMYKDESQSIEVYLEPQYTEDLWALVIQRWVKDYSWNCEKQRKSRRKKASFDAYLHIPIHPDSQRYLHFALRSEHYQFFALPFGQASAPWVFTKVMGALTDLVFLEDKVLQNMQEVSQALERPSATVREYMRALGQLVSTLEAVPYSQVHIRERQRLVIQNWHRNPALLDQKLSLFPEARQDLQWYSRGNRDSGRSLLDQEGVACGTGIEGWVVDVLCLLCTSRSGLSDHDILQLLKVLGYHQNLEVTPLHWAAFRLATSNWIWEKPDGLLHFSHRSLRDAVEHLLLGAIMPIRESLDETVQKAVSDKRKHFHQLLVKYFQQLGLSRKVYEEVPWHLKMIGDQKGLYMFLSNNRILGLVSRYTKYGYQMKMDFIHYWQILSLSGKDPAVAYQVMPSSITEAMNEDCCEVTDWYRGICFVAQSLKDIGKTKEASNILSSIETQLASAGSEKANVEVLLWTLKQFADLYCEMGSWQEAFQYYQKALSSLEQFTAGEDENDGHLLQLKGRLMCHLAILDATECSGQCSQFLEEAIKHFQLFAPKPHEQAMLQLCQGLYKFSAGDLSKSEKHLRECLDLRRKLYGRKHILTGEVQEYLADLESHPCDNKYSHRLHALENYKEVIEIKEAHEALSRSPQIKQHLRLSLSNTLFKTGKLLCQTDFGVGKEGIKMLQRSLDLRTSIVGSDHPLSFDVQSFLREVKSRCSDGKVPFETEKQPSLIRPKSVKSNRRSGTSTSTTHQHPPIVHKTTTVGHLDSSNEKKVVSNFFLSACGSSLEQTAHTPLLQTGKCPFFYDEDTVPSPKNITSEEYVPFQSVLISPEFNRKRPTSMTSSITSHLLSRPVSVCQTSISGPLSYVTSLLQHSRLVSGSNKHTLIHKSAWYHVPGRYPTLQTPLPPKRNQICKEQ